MPKTGFSRTNSAKRFEKVHHIQEFEHGGAFAAWDDEAIDGIQLFGGADFHRVAARVFDGFRVCVEVPLQGEDSDALFGLDLRAGPFVADMATTHASA